MKSAECDVYLCCRDGEDPGMASDVAAGLGRFGFRVCVSGRDAPAAPGPERLAWIERAPDFVLLSAPSSGGPADGRDDARRADFAHAFKTRRNILVLADPAHADPLAGSGLPGRPTLAPWQRVAYDPERPRESIALVAHRLLSSSEVDERRLMRTAKRAFIALGVVLLVAVASRAVPLAVRWWNQPAAAPPLPRYVLYWSAYGQRPQNGQWTPFPLSDGDAVRGGDQVRLVFSGGSDGYAYVVARDSQGGVSVLFPGTTVRGASRVRSGTAYDAPAGAGWLTVDERAGLEAIYLIAGHDPLENLEELAEDGDGSLTAAARMDLLSSTISGLLDGKRTAVPRPIRTRAGREIVDGLAPAAAPIVWPRAPGDDRALGAQPAVQIGLLSAVVELRLRPIAR